MDTTERDPEAFSASVYQINRFDCPACGAVNESDADFAAVESCKDCHEQIELAQ